MKLMSGAVSIPKILPGFSTQRIAQEPERKPDYRSQTLHELEKLQSKVILLNDLLDNVDTSKGEKFANGDAYDVSIVQPLPAAKREIWH